MDSGREVTELSGVGGCLRTTALNIVLGKNNCFVVSDAK